MAWSWKILRAAVEQEILFPAEDIFNTYIKSLQRKNEPFEITSKVENKDGSLTVIMRKRYNPQNPFLYKR